MCGKPIPTKFAAATASRCLRGSESCHTLYFGCGEYTRINVHVLIMVSLCLMKSNYGQRILAASKNERRHKIVNGYSQHHM